MKMKYIAVALATCLVALLMTLSIGATDVTTAETTADTTVETTVETDADTTVATVTTEETVAEPTETAAESDKDGLAFRPETLKNTLPIMGMGMLGIFLVTGVIVLVIMLLNKISNAVEARKGGEDVE